MHINCLHNPTQRQVDVILATVPWTDSAIPLMAPAALKPAVERAGMTCLGVDLNIEIYNLTAQHPHRDHIIKFYFDGQSHELVDEWLYDMFESTARALLTWKPKFIGLSLFSYVSRTACEWLCYFIKKLSPDTKIIIGGAGCLEQFTGPSTFADVLTARNLIDYHIRGDGENTLYQLLIGNTTQNGINSVTWDQIDSAGLALLPHPDYTDYDFSLYKKRLLGIHGSRGCVRQCTFCDFIANWTKFNWRTADDIFDEMMVQYQRYGIRHFKFHDALTNGNLKEFNKLIRLLADYNLSNPEQAFRWSGYYIFRDRVSNDDELWKTMSDSGTDVLAVGIENLNEDIRFAIGKKFSNAAIDYHIKESAKYGIKLDLLFIVGYVNETQQHIDFAKQWLVDHVPFIDNIILQWGGSLGIFPNTYLHRNQKKLGIQMIGDKPNMWINPEVGSTPAQRAQWVHDLTKFSEGLGYNVVSHLDNHFILEQLINTNS